MPQAPPLAFVHECYYVCLRGGAELVVWHIVYHLFPFTPFYLPFGKIRRIVWNRAKGLSSLGLSDVLGVFISRKWLHLGLDKDIVKKGKISTKAVWLKLYLKFIHVWHPFKNVDPQSTLRRLYFYRNIVSTHTSHPSKWEKWAENNSLKVKKEMQSSSLRNQ